MVLMTEQRTSQDQAPATPKLVTTGQAAELIGYGLDYRGVRRMVEAGELPSVQHRQRGWYRVPLDAVLAKRDELDLQAGVKPHRSAEDYRYTQ